VAVEHQQHSGIVRNDVGVFRGPFVKRIATFVEARVILRGLRKTLVALCSSLSETQIAFASMGHELLDDLVEFRLSLLGGPFCGDILVHTLGSGRRAVVGNAEYDVRMR